MDGTNGTNTTLDDIRNGERTERDVWHDVYSVMPPAVCEQVGLSLAGEGLLSMYRAKNVPSSFFNRMVGLGLDRPLERDELNRYLDQYFELKVPFVAAVTPGVQPPELPSWLEARGLKRTTTLARMVRDTKDLPDPGDVPIRIVGREDAHVFAEITARSFGMPPFCVDWFAQLPGREGWRTYVAYHSGEPVAGAALYVHGKVGWLGFGCTLPEHRRRGVQRALMARRIVDAADLGCRWLQTETNLQVADEPTPSLNNMKRLGFTMAYGRTNYSFTPPAA